MPTSPPEQFVEERRFSTNCVRPKDAPAFSNTPGFENEAEQKPRLLPGVLKKTMDGLFQKTVGPEVLINEGHRSIPMQGG
jgi:hypothetical protein